MNEAVSPLAAWGGTMIRPVHVRENAVYEVTVQGRRAALRLHRPGYQTPGAIRSELWWCGALANAGFPCPRPIETEAGELTAPAGDRLASLVEWLPGKPIGISGTPLAGTIAEQARLFARIGLLIAELHDLTDRLTPPDWFERPSWDAEALLGEDPRWGRFWLNPALLDTDCALLAEARATARSAMGGDFGLIHADFMRENLLSRGTGLSLIDFDDSGFGHRFYDLASALIQNLEEPALPRLGPALLEGYGARRPLPPDAPRQLTLFTFLRACASCGWIMTRAAPGDPRCRGYAERAVRMARLWLDGGTL